MSFDTVLFGSKVRRCRQQLVLSYEQLATSSGVPADRVQTLEAGAAIPTGDEVLLLAHAFKKDYRFFVSDERIDPIDETEELFRSQGTALSADDRRAIYEFLFLCESEHQLSTLLERESGTLPRAAVPSPIPAGYTWRTANVDGRRSAKLLRDSLGLSDTGVPADVFAAIRRLGVHVFRRKLQNSDVSGLYILHPTAGGCLLVNYAEDEYRQRFTAAHEAGHAVMDFAAGHVISKDSERTSFRERRANAFAGAFLVPPGAVEQLRRRRGFSREDMATFASRLQVSVMTLCIELQAAGVLTWDQSQALSKGNSLTRKEKPDAELSNVTGHERDRKERLLERGLSSHYVRLCLDAYHQRKVSRARLCEMMLTTPVELQEIAGSFGMKWDDADNG